MSAGLASPAALGLVSVVPSGRAVDRSKYANMAFYEPGYASSSDDDDREYDDDPDVTLDDIDKSKTINFSIRANYTDWEPREAFRELVQNW